ncbi:hypothetical protein F5B21DRAFT_384204 [Xylaria acuta]|nr:hypothetical protein F5B21DRAFT_384204 [Xylaria acuta]
MSQKRHTDGLAGSGHLTIVVSMIIFVVLLLIIWALMGFQIYRLRMQRLADLESGIAAEVGTIDGDVPLDNILKGTRYSQVQSARASGSSWASLAVTHETHKGSSNKSSKSGVPRTSQWYREERPVSYFFYKICGVFKKQQNETPKGERGSDMASVTPEPGRTAPRLNSEPRQN